jgi:hypothetical protein
MLTVLLSICGIVIAEMMPFFKDFQHEVWFELPCFPAGLSDCRHLF